MQRFFLNVRHGAAIEAPDEDGAEFEGIEQAYLAAFKSAQELWQELLRRHEDPRPYTYEITNAAGIVLMELSFSEVLEACHPRDGSVHSLSRIG